MQAAFQATVMNFLNEVASEFPAAISLAAGRPADRLFERLDHSALLQALIRYEKHALHGHTGKALNAWLLQYGRTAGLIHELVAHQVQTDEGVATHADRTVITAGCQEALALCLPELCPDPKDVVLVCNPTYIGITGAAHASGVALSALPGAESDIAAQIERAVAQLHREGRQARAVYLIPDFDNPTGRVLDLSQRRAVLSACTRHRIVVLEDNPYGMFRYDGDVVPPMAALDEVGCVIYLSTYSKTISPALRVGALTLPDTLFGDRAARQALFQALVQRKSFITVNTSQICQAIIGGLLLEQEGSLRGWIQPTLEAYRVNRDTMLAQLQTTFVPWPDSIRWNRPDGGFFLTVDLPFRFDAQAVTACATECHVIVMPMAFFAFDNSHDQRIRLAFSAVDPSQIRTGIAALGRFIERKMTQAQSRSGTPIPLAG
ncbi:PLP-dependent aminotransferase family protein [Burkholderia sp. Se-20378]|uniref:aminotransferase-like domain-containing protein n=1 Tax=Burkholderia sp. Se-20378 TaxID=2703899 RepID=UPI00197E7C1E|nr:PLP-dependent aminotransferase family protein [Burkholderia sp. Se-20378]MBN3772776.1 PLP-dependent aminotransferase family protein [Burkholderia sp. Se-20378]